MRSQRTMACGRAAPQDGVLAPHRIPAARRRSEPSPIAATDVAREGVARITAAMLRTVPNGWVTCCRFGSMALGAESRCAWGCGGGDPFAQDHAYPVAHGIAARAGDAEAWASLMTGTPPEGPIGCESSCAHTAMGELRPFGTGCASAPGGSLSGLRRGAPKGSWRRRRGIWGSRSPRRRRRLAHS